MKPNSVGDDGHSSVPAPAHRPPCAGSAPRPLIQDVVDLVADRILPAFGAHGMIMSTAQAGRIQIIGSRGYDPAVIEQFDGLSTDADLTPAGRALTTGAASFFADRGELARLYPRAPQITDKHAWAFLPLLSSGHPIGCLLLAYNDPHPFSAAERSVLTPLAGLIAQALDRARLHDESTTSPMPCSRPSSPTPCPP